MQSTPKGPSYLLMFTNMMCCFTQQMMLFNSKCSTAQHTLPGNTFFFFFTLFASFSHITAAQ